MVDLHAHILPGIDDGAVDMYDSLEMARIAVAGGVGTMIATPHCNIPGMYDNYFGQSYIELYRQVEAMLIQEKIPLMLYAGMEVFMTSDVTRQLADGKILTLNGGHYMLVEFAFDEDPDFVEHMLAEVARVKIHPVIAHPERYEFVKEDIRRVYDWRKKGYLIQVNKGSLMGKFGDRTEFVAHELMRHRLVTAIASDAHSPVRRTPYLLDVYKELRQMYSSRYLQLLFEENPMRIIKDQPVLHFEARPFAEEEW